MGKITPIEEQINALLRKAESTTPEEAEALTEHAVRLMRRHGIQQAMLDAQRNAGSAHGEQIIEKYFWIEGIYAMALTRGMCHIVNSSGEMRGLVAGRGNRRAVVIIGYESDVQQMETLLQSLQLQAIAGLAAFWRGPSGARIYRNDGTAGWNARKSYVIGFMDGARRRISDNRLRVEREISTETSGGSDLVLVSRRDAVEKWVEQTYEKLGRSRGMKVTTDGYVSGHRDGRNAHTGEAGIGQRRALEG